MNSKELSWSEPKNRNKRKQKTNRQKPWGKCFKIKAL